MQHYPYSDDGAIAVPAQADWLDPMIALAFAELGVDELVRVAGLPRSPIGG